MTITTTAISFLLCASGFAFCGIRFFRAFYKIGGVRAGNRIGILLSVLFFSFTLELGTLGIGVLFFVGTQVMLYVLIITHIFSTSIAVFGIYLVFYMVVPSISPWPAVFAVLALGISVIILATITHPHPFIDASGGVDWNYSHSLNTLLFYLLFIGIAALLVIFTHSFLQAKSREVKVVSLVQIGLALIGMINIFMRFFLVDGTIPALLRTRLFDVILGVIGIVYISIFLLPPVIIKWFSRIKNE